MSDLTVLAVLTPPVSLYSAKRFRQLPEIPVYRVDRPLPSLSIIVPARNEADNLHRLLPSLIDLSYPGQFEIVIVDDNSSDDTAQVTREYGFEPLHLSELPSGWLGKPHACHRGALKANGDWLLFTDADTVHHPNGPASAVAFACQNKLDGLSAFLSQNTRGVLDSTSLPVAFAGLFATAKAEFTHLNGQYILLRKDVYFESTGFQAVARESMEDLALGLHLHRLGYHVPILRSQGIAQVHMYDDPKDLWQGLVRITAGSLKYSGVNSLVTALFVTGIMAPLALVLSALRRPSRLGWALSSWLIVVTPLVPWFRQSGKGSDAILAPFGAFLVQCAAVWGLARRLFKVGILWKGRRV